MNVIFRPNYLTNVSFYFSLCIAKHGKSVSDWDFIKTALLTGSDSLFYDFSNKHEILKRISEIPLSRNTVKNGVLRIANDVNLRLAIDLQRLSVTIRARMRVQISIIMQR